MMKELLLEKKILIVCGSGGVGKTTLSATLALNAARLGRRAIVLTIDPAKRLANSLGLSQIGHEPKEIEAKVFKGCGISMPGTLSAMMLDTKRTFDTIIERYAPNETTKTAILNNPIYHHLSNMVAGSSEYMAMEKLYEIYSKGDYDLLVLDTPPTQHALDFLDAPSKMANLLGDSLFKLLLKPSIFLGKKSFQVLQSGSKRLLRVLDKIVGFEFLQDLSVLFLTTGGMLEGFKERAEEVGKILRQDSTQFLLVATPNRLSIQESKFFLNKIQELELPFENFIFNRVHSPLENSWVSETNKTFNKCDCVAAGLNLITMYETLAKQDRTLINKMKLELATPCTYTEISQFETDIHGPQGLVKIGNALL